MQIDLYTKAVLTVIAISLSAIALQHTIPNAFAQAKVDKPIRVTICDPDSEGIFDRMHCAKIPYSALTVTPVSLGQ